MADLQSAALPLGEGAQDGRILAVRLEAVNVGFNPLTQPSPLKGRGLGEGAGRCLPTFFETLTWTAKVALPQPSKCVKLAKKRSSPATSL